MSFFFSLLQCCLLHLMHNNMAGLGGLGGSDVGVSRRIGSCTQKKKKKSHAISKPKKGEKEKRMGHQQ
jgi:hypothetical protein